MRKTIVGLAVLAFIAVGCSTTPDAEPGTITPPAVTVTTEPVTPTTEPTEAQSATKPAPPPADIALGAGTWEVPGEVKPGTYTTTADSYCYWARLKGFDGELESIAANGNLDPGGRGRITVKKADKGLELTGDCTWTRS